jgi:hypothetical protein
MKEENDRLLNQVSSYQIGEKAFKSKILADSSTLATQTQTILTQGEAMKLGLLRMDGEIKQFKSQIRYLQELTINDVPVQYIPDDYADTTEWIAKFKKGDTSKAICDSLIANSIIVPKRFGVSDKWYSINGKVNKDGLLIDSLKLTNESSVSVGYKKSGFLNLKREAIVEIKNTNPYLNVSKMNNVVLKDKKGIFQSKWFWSGLGVIGGFYLHNKLTN